MRLEQLGNDDQLIICQSSGSAERASAAPLETYRQRAESRPLRSKRALRDMLRAADRLRAVGFRQAGEGA